MELFNILDESIKQLDLSQQNLTSVRGIEKFSNLKKLSLRGNLLTDCSFLKFLPKLVEIDLSFNQIETIFFDNTLLQKVNLEGNQLTNIDFAKSLKYLSELNVRDDKITNLSPLQGHEQLTYLNIRGNAVSSLDPLAKVSSLSNLNARDNSISSITPIIHLPLQNRLFLSGNDITDLHFLKEKTIEKTDYKMTIPKPTFNRQSGVYQSFELILNGEKNSEIYYTLDGTDPTIHSTRYTKPILISEHKLSAQPTYANYQTSPLQRAFSFQAQDVKAAVSVKTIAHKNGQISDTAFATYILDASLFKAKSLPVLSLVMDPKDLFDHKDGIYVPGAQYTEYNADTGNYYGRGRAFEKESYVDFFHKNGDLNFKQKLGVRINGSYTRRLPQKSLRLYARKRYGQSRITTGIFPELTYNQFKIVVLHNGGNDYYSTIIRDGLMHELIKDINIDTQAYQPALVLINGEYWGIHHLREKYNKHYLQIKYNVHENDLVLLKLSKNKGSQFNVEVGNEKDKTYFDNLIHYVTHQSTLTEKEINYIDTIIDIDNFFTYVACQVYYGNTDSFSNNVMIWRKKTAYVPNAPNGHDGRFRWMLYDLDWGMGYRFDDLLNYKSDPIAFNMLTHVLSDKKEMSLFSNLMRSPLLKSKFKNILLTLLRTNFETVRVISKIDELTATIRPEISKSLDRWENVASIEQWETNIKFLYEFAARRPEIMRRQLKELMWGND